MRYRPQGIPVPLGLFLAVNAANYTQKLGANALFRLVVPYSSLGTGPAPLRAAAPLPLTLQGEIDHRAWILYPWKDKDSTPYGQLTA